MTEEGLMARRGRERREAREVHALRGPSCLTVLAGVRKLDVLCARCAVEVGHDPIAPLTPGESWTRWVHYPECPRRSPEERAERRARYVAK